MENFEIRRFFSPKKEKYKNGNRERDTSKDSFLELHTERSAPKTNRKVSQVFGTHTDPPWRNEFNPTEELEIDRTVGKDEKKMLIASVLAGLLTTTAILKSVTAGSIIAKAGLIIGALSSGILVASATGLGLYFIYRGLARRDYRKTRKLKP